jgi:hypothetical protein
MKNSPVRKTPAPAGTVVRFERGERVRLIKMGFKPGFMLDRLLANDARMRMARMTTEEVPESGELPDSNVIEFPG